MSEIKKFRSKPYEIQAIELAVPMTTKNEQGEEVTYQAGDYLVLNDDGTQTLATKADVETNFDEVKPRTRKPAEQTPVQ
jgi:hypothetical protein